MLNNTGRILIYDMTNCSDDTLHFKMTTFCQPFTHAPMVPSSTKMHNNKSEKRVITYPNICIKVLVFTASFRRKIYPDQSKHVQYASFAEALSPGAEPFHLKSVRTKIGESKGPCHIRSIPLHILQGIQ